MTPSRYDLWRNNNGILLSTPKRFTDTRKSQKINADCPLFHWLIIGQWILLNLYWLGLGGHTVKNLLWLACKFDLDQSERKSLQVNAGPGQTQSQEDPSFQLASTCDSVWPGLQICLHQKWNFYIFYKYFYPAGRLVGTIRFYLFFFPANYYF